jgi:predicted RNA binding protein YcfA (HicA-like mRNA interferase family)
MTAHHTFLPVFALYSHPLGEQITTMTVHPKDDCSSYITYQFALYSHPLGEQTTTMTVHPKDECKNLEFICNETKKNKESMPNYAPICFSYQAIVLTD